jgi:hypothetical protein
METNYVILLDFCSGTLNIIKLDDRDKTEMDSYDDFEEFLSTLEDKYEFRLRDCQWMCCETLSEYRYENGILATRH